MSAWRFAVVVFILCRGLEAGWAAERPLPQPVSKEGIPVLTFPTPPGALPPPVPPPDPSAGTVYLSLRECVALALQSNLDIAVDRISPLIARATTLSSHGVFDPMLRVDAQYGESNAPSLVTSTNFDTAIVTTQTNSGTFDVNLSQKTALGTTLALDANTLGYVTLPSTLGTQYLSFAGLTVTQPVLRNFGVDVNMAPIRIARRGELAADANFEFQVEQIVTNIIFAYDELIFARRNLESQEFSLRLAEQSLHDNEERVKIGTMSPLDVSQARADSATRLGDVISARNAIRLNENALKRLISSDMVAWLNTNIVPTDQPPENYLPPPTLSSIATGLRNRADYRAAVEAAEQSNLQVTFDKNQLLPQLDIRGSLGYAGLGFDPITGYSRAAGGSNDAWYIGLTLQVPFGNREARGQLDAAKAQRNLAILNLKRSEQDIILQVDNAAGTAEANQQRVVSTRSARRLAEETLKAEQEKLNAGASTTFVVLRLQRDLTDARTTELRAIADLQNSVAELERVQGLTLRKNGVEIEAPPSWKIRRITSTDKTNPASPAPPPAVR